MILVPVHELLNNVTVSSSGHYLLHSRHGIKYSKCQVLVGKDDVGVDGGELLNVKALIINFN